MFFKYLFIVVSSFIAFMPLKPLKQQKSSPYITTYDEHAFSKAINLNFDLLNLTPTNSNSLHSKLQIKYTNGNFSNLYFSASYQNLYNTEYYFIPKTLLRNSIFQKNMFDINLNYIELPKIISFKFEVEDSFKKVHEILNFKINNPKYKSNLNETNKIYYRLISDVNNNRFLNYYSEFKVTTPKKYYYYDHFNFEKDLSLKVMKNRAISLPMLYIKEEDTNYFNNCCINLAGYSNIYKFFSLNAFENMNTGQVNFKFGKSYFYNKQTHLMSDENSPGYDEVEGRVYLPLNEYRVFRNVEFGIDFKFNSGTCNFPANYKFNVQFDNNYYKDDTLITKEIIKKTTDSSFSEVIL